jgi:predicted permease
MSAAAGAHWSGRGYWVLACGLLPLLNPIALAVISIATDTDGPPWPVIAVVIALVNLLLLWLAGSRIWKRPEDQRWRIALALVLAVVLSLPYGFGELLLFLDLACREQCFS